MVGDQAFIVRAMSDRSRSGSSRDPGFVTTHWSVVLAARPADSSRARQALETLCRTYWYPLYAFARRVGHSPHDAEDLVQSFFARCLEKNYLDAADQAKGRFRSFLLLALKRFLANEWDKQRAQKRGGGAPLIALDALTAEERYGLEPAQHLSADRLFERRWALTLLEQVLERLRAEQAEAGRLTQFEQLKEALIGGGGRDAPYARLAEQLGTSEAAVKVAVHRLRRRYRELLEAEIAHTVGTPEDVADERRYLLAVLSG
jgi:RNA polymerase sigma-70 factor (ECF subfamily)